MLKNIFITSFTILCFSNNFPAVADCENYRDYEYETDKKEYILQVYQVLNDDKEFKRVNLQTYNCNYEQVNLGGYARTSSVLIYSEEVYKCGNITLISNFVGDGYINSMTWKLVDKNKTEFNLERGYDSNCYSAGNDYLEEMEEAFTSKSTCTTKVYVSTYTARLDNSPHDTIFDIYEVNYKKGTLKYEGQENPQF